MDTESNGYERVYITNGYSKHYAPAISERFELDPGNKESSQELMDYVVALKSFYGR